MLTPCRVTGAVVVFGQVVGIHVDERFVKDGKVDLLCGATTATLSRREVVDFSIPTFVDGASVLLNSEGPQSFGDLDGKKVGVPKTVRLACYAVADGIDDYGGPPRQNKIEKRV